MRLAYFDCFSGISGDMALGALVHAGADLDQVVETLATLPIEGYTIEREEAEDHGIWATRIHVKVKPQALVRTYSSVRGMLEMADLPAGARRTADRVFHRLATALAKVHGKEPGVVTFHELGEVECMVEILGCALALDQLAVDRVFASAVPTGMGMVRTEHGVMPVPSAEVVELLQAVPTFTRGIPVELVTPVGAAILAALVEGFGDMPMMRADHVGYGAGHPRLDFPNVLRVVIGEEERAGVRTGPGNGTGHEGHPSAGGRGIDDLPPAMQPASMDLPMVGAAHLTMVPEPEEAPDVLVEAILAPPSDPDELFATVFEAGATDAWLTPAVVAGGEAVRLSAVTTMERSDDVAGSIRSLSPLGEIRCTRAWRWNG